MFRKVAASVCWEHALQVNFKVYANGNLYRV
jgi:hypothetical protein